MRSIIERHNRLNGVMFSTIEFALIAAFVGAFAIYYLVHYRWGMALITWGITFNCLPFVVLGIQELCRRRHTGERIGSFWDKTARVQHRAENPNMFRDTVTIMVATLLPFVGFTAILVDKVTEK